MELVSMKLPPKPASEESMGMPAEVEMEMPLYPWGLEIRLDNDSLTKLGITAESLPAVSSSLMLTAKVDVTEVSSEQRAGQGPELEVKLQITDMALATKPEGAQAIFNASGMNP